MTLSTIENKWAGFTVIGHINNSCTRDRVTCNLYTYLEKGGSVWTAVRFLANRFWFPELTMRLLTARERRQIVIAIAVWVREDCARLGKNLNVLHS